MWKKTVFDVSGDDIVARFRQLSYVSNILIDHWSTLVYVHSGSSGIAGLLLV